MSFIVCLLMYHVFVDLPAILSYCGRSSKRVIFVVVEGKRKKKNRLSIRECAEKFLFKVISYKRNVLFVQKQGTTQKCPVKSSRSKST